MRPPADQRTFRSDVVDKAVDDLAAKLADPTLACIFKNAFPNCLDTTIYQFSKAGSTESVGRCSATPGECGVVQNQTKDDAFVVTGDIPAMWLRDSMNQVLPYIRFAKQDPQLQALLRGLVHRQAAQILTDVYANAHNIDRSTGQTPNTGDHTSKPSYLGTTVSAMTPLIFERKYELDSLCAFLKLGAEYVRATGDVSALDAQWVQAVRTVVATMRSQQTETADDEGIYSFQRCSSCEPTDTLSHGVGFPGARTGMVRSAFRPSDDATQYPFLVPANAMAVVELRATKELLDQIGESELAKDVDTLASEIDSAIRAVAVVPHKSAATDVFAYEVDGYGNSYHMDDANVPSLLSLPYLGYVPANDTTYGATRRIVLNTTTNPYYFEGAAGSGVGSPHTGLGRPWHMSIIMQAMTSDSDEEIQSCLKLLKATTASKWFMHESFWKDDSDNFSRPWFSWANSLFGELIWRLSETKPHLVLASEQIKVL